MYGIFLHHTRQLLLSGITHAPLILSYEIIFYKGTVASLPDHLFTGLSSRILWIELNQMCGISAFVFHGTRASNKMTSGRLTDQYMGINLQFHCPDGDCHAGTCHKISNLTNWKKISCAWDPCLHRWVDRTLLRSVHRSVPPNVGISIFNRKSRIRILGGVSNIWK